MSRENGHAVLTPHVQGQQTLPQTKRHESYQVLMGVGGGSEGSTQERAILVFELRQMSDSMTMVTVWVQILPNHSQADFS